ncbi:hypothetical protein Z043_122138 [Scleropages formosus]|uniref:CXXC motif containing zinc binding protein n=1 Tax=Scleropages formosus TaxID=113540 RepID=A0A0P7TGF8_SCLFO|nr:hypothetical protein Z043_122138 [Scleropages formosus]
MVKFALQFKATLEHVTNLRPEGDDFRWFLKVECDARGAGPRTFASSSCRRPSCASLKCGNCGEISDKWQYITLMVRG